MLHSPDDFVGPGSWPDNLDNRSGLGDFLIDFELYPLLFCTVLYSTFYSWGRKKKCFRRISLHV